MKAWGGGDGARQYGGARTASPFEPSIKELEGGRKVITGRGTADDKGQLMTFVEACRAYKDINGSLPCEVPILFEGEEETGSPSWKPMPPS